MNERLSAEELSAYVDGELSDERARELEAALEFDPAARDEVQRLREIDGMLKGAYGEILGEPVPFAVASQAHKSLAGTGGAAQAGSPPRTPGWRAWGLQALAASLLAVMLSFPAGFYLSDLRNQAETARLEGARAADRQAVAAAMAEALEERLSGVSVHWHNPTSGNEGKITPVRTFRNRDGSWCREYREETVKAGTARSQQAIACRSAEGEWLTRLVALGESQGS